MRVYSSTTTREFIDQLRYVLIGANAHQLVIDKVDALQDADKLEAEIEELGTQLYDAEEERDAYKFKFECLLEACNAEQDPSEALLAAIQKASVE